MWLDEGYAVGERDVAYARPVSVGLRTMMRVSARFADVGA